MKIYQKNKCNFKRKRKILIIDFGSQVTKLIARRIRDLGVYSEVITPKEIKRIKNFELIKGIVLSGGPSSVTSRGFQSVPKKYILKKFQYLVYVMDYNLFQN